MTADEYRYLSPPIEVLAYLNKAVAAYGEKTPQPIWDYCDKWQRINAGEPMPELDAMTQRTEQ